MTREDALEFERLFNSWASADYQMQRSVGLEAGGKEHLFISFLLARRPEIIDAVMSRSIEVRV